MEDTRKYHKPTPRQVEEAITAEQLELMRYNLKGMEDFAKDMMEKLKIDSLEKFPKSIYVATMNRIQEVKKLRAPKRIICPCEYNK